MPYEAPPDLAAMSLGDIAEAVAARKLPPVEAWTPSETLDSHMRIAADGRWLHEDSPITRPAMVRAFASLLTRDENGDYWLMTPHARHAITVEDAPFMAVDMQRKGDALAFRLNTDELVLAGPDHPLRAEGDPQCPAVYLMVRRGCEARLDRSTWLQLVEHALAEGESEPLSVRSQSATFPLVPSA